MTHARDAVTRWLLGGDAAIRWQVHRDLLDSAASTVERERRKVATEGWGKRILALQAAGGSWGGGMYNPKWTSTFYTMMLLRDFGLSPANRQAKRGCALLLDQGLRPNGGVNYKRGAPGETCVTGMALSIAAYFEHADDRIDTIAGFLRGEQMADGGWNCRRASGATHSSVNTTISVLEGLRFYELLQRRGVNAVAAAQRKGRAFLLVHRLFRSHRTGKVIKSEFTRFSFPPRWHYDVLRALDHFQSVNAPRDERLADAVALMRSKRGADGRWRLEHIHKGQVHFELERAGEPSRWNTLRALRVLRWWEGGRTS